ncbi:MAG: transposase [Verrucomicrobiae bacterium]|nr:transposase [Verrucomicrobiae bacterium]
MARFDKKKSGFHIELTDSKESSAHGGQLLIDALCQRYGLWEKLEGIPGLDVRTRTSVGFSPRALVAQLLFCLTSGGSSLADAERMGQDMVLMGMLGLSKGADQSTFGEWLRGQSKQSVEAFHDLIVDFVRWALGQIKSGRAQHHGELEVFFDDTEVEVQGKYFEGARRNYDGELALSWQTLWVGPFVADAILDGACNVGQHLEELLASRKELWQAKSSRFFADSGSSSSTDLQQIGKAGFSHWSVSYNKWVKVPQRLAAELPEMAWGEEEKQGDETSQYAWLRYQPEESQTAHLLAVVRRKNADELLWRYYFVATDPNETSKPEEVFLKHRRKGAREQGFSHLLSDLDLHHPPCESLIANQMFYAIGILAHNLLAAFKALHLDAEQQGWRPGTLIRHLLTLPVRISRHSRYVRAWICVPAGWMSWFRLFQEQWIPKRPWGGARIKGERSVG